MRTPATADQRALDVFNLATWNYSLDSFAVSGADWENVNWN